MYNYYPHRLVLGFLSLLIYIHTYIYERYIFLLDFCHRSYARSCATIIEKLLTPDGDDRNSILLTCTPPVTRVYCCYANNEIGKRLPDVSSLVQKFSSRRSRPKESLHLLNPHILTRLSSAPTPLTGTYSICAVNVCTFTSRRYVQRTACLRSTLFPSSVDPRQPERPTPAPRYRA